MKKRLLLLSGFSATLLLVPLSLLYAAEIFLVPSNDVAFTGEEMAVDLYLDTEQKAINAVSGKVTIVGPTFVGTTSTVDDAMLRRIHDGDSIVGAWLSKADVSDPKQITFSGIVPGGITTEKGKVMTLYFLSRTPGVINLTVTGTVFEDKASGVPLTLRPNSVVVPIREGSSGALSSTPPRLDITPPYGVKAIIAQNDKMFGGKPFVIINAKDKESGIATHDLLEVSRPYDMATLSHDVTLPWRRVENPAALLYPLETTYVYVRVIDREGNATIISASSPGQLSTEKTDGPYNIWLTYGILTIPAILLPVAGFFLWFLLRGRKHHA